MKKTNQDDRKQLLTVKFFAEYYSLLILRWFFLLLPVTVSSWGMGKLWRFMAPLSHRHERAHAHLFAAMPELSEQKRRQFISDMWENLGRVMAEGLVLDKIRRDPDRISHNFDASLVPAVREKSGAMITGLHYGNWEIYGVKMGQMGLPGMAAYQEAKNPYVDKLALKLRHDSFPCGLVAKGTHTARKLLAGLKAGHIISLLVDHRDSNGMTMDFFERACQVSIFPALMCWGQNAPLFVARVNRLPGVKFYIECVEIPINRTDNRKRDIEAASIAIQKQFEDWIKEKPEHWMWAHMKWGSAASDEMITAYKQRLLVRKEQT